jgi:hypothetical protein
MQRQTVKYLKEKSLDRGSYRMRRTQTRDRYGCVRVRNYQEGHLELFIFGNRLDEIPVNVMCAGSNA